MTFDVKSDEARPAAVESVRAGDLVVIPTDTVYGIAADAFNPAAVARLLSVKGRSRTMPAPILISDTSVLPALTIEVPGWLTTMLDELWPGALTVICRSQPSLSWDLGETRGTVAIRVPDREEVREILRSTGPLAVSSANLTGRAAATTVTEASEMLGEQVAVYLDGGPAPTATASTILDATSTTPRVVRRGGVSMNDLHRFNNTIEVDAPDA